MLPPCCTPTVSAVFVVGALALGGSACSKSAPAGAVDAGARVQAKAASDGRSAASPAGGSGIGALAPLTDASADAAAESVTGCTVDVPRFAVDKGARGDTGITLAKLGDGRVAVGYATGEGAPKVAFIDPAGSVVVAEVDISHVKDLEAKLPPRAARFVFRVTPLHAEGTKVKVAVDYAELHADRTRLVRCGAADADPILSFAGASAFDPQGDAGGAPPGTTELRECRTFANGDAWWAVGYEAAREGDQFDARWIVKAPGDAEPTLVDHKMIPKEPGRAIPSSGSVDRYGFTLEQSSKVADAGYVMAARYNGRLVVSRRTVTWGAIGPLGEFWHGAPIGLPTIATEGNDVALVFPLFGKPESLGTRFAIDAVPSKPALVALSTAPAGMDRVSLSTAFAAGDVVLAFAEGSNGKRQVRVARLDSSFAPHEGVLDLTAPGDDAPEVKVLAIDDARVVVAFIEAAPAGRYTVNAAVLRCGPRTTTATGTPDRGNPP